MYGRPDRFDCWTRCAASGDFGERRRSCRFFSLRNHVRLSTDVIAAWDTFALFVLASAWLTILTTPQQKLRARAQEQDFGRTVIFIFVVVAACAALFAVGFLVKVGRSEVRGHFTGHLMLGLATVVLSWSLMHTVFGLRYAHAFYGVSDQPGESRHAGGLVFPGERMPDYFDFCLLFVRYRHDLPSLGCANYFTPDAAADTPAQCARVWIQYHHPCSLN